MQNKMEHMTHLILARTGRQAGNWRPEYYQNNIFADNGQCPSGAVSTLRSKIQRRCKVSFAFLSRSVSGHGICPNDVSGKSARYGGLFASANRQPVSHGISRPIRRSTLSDANEKRDWRIYARLAQVLIRKRNGL